MIIRIGSLCITWGVTTVVNPKVVLVDLPIKVIKPVFVEEIKEVPNPIIKRVDYEVEIPNFPIKHIDHQLVAHRYVVNEKPYPINVNKPIIEESETPVVVQKIKFEEQKVPMPHYRIIHEGRKDITVAPTDIFEITCLCGNKYMSNNTKCLKCGRSTIATLEKFSEVK